MAGKENNIDILERLGEQISLGMFWKGPEYEETLMEHIKKWIGGEELLGYLAPGRIDRLFEIMNDEKHFPKDALAQVSLLTSKRICRMLLTSHKDVSFEDYHLLDITHFESINKGTQNWIEINLKMSRGEKLCITGWNNEYNYFEDYLALIRKQYDALR